MSPRPIRTEDELRTAARHVCYEIEMLRFSGADLGPSCSSPPTTRSGNEAFMALESFLLHFRTLRAFLCPSLQRCSVDDIIASDFLNETTANDYGDKSLLEVDRERIDKMLAHLSYSRQQFIDQRNQLWYTASMSSHILAGLGAFVLLLVPDRAAWFPSRKELVEAERCSKLIAGTLMADTCDVGLNTIGSPSAHVLTSPPDKNK